MSKAVAFLAAGLVLAGASGFLTSQALSGTTAAPRTTTINVGTGATGPQGPPGPAGPRGETGPAGLACPQGYSEGRLVINHPGGQTAIWTCLGD